MNYDEIGKFILKLRKEKGYSQNTLANIIPISRQAISKWERGITIPDSSTLVRLSEIFDVSINELLKGERSNDNSIEGLQKTTLSIVDDNVLKTKKMRRNIQIFIVILIILISSFFTYYFINSYNSIKMYYISGDGDVFHIENGLFVMTPSRKYLKIDSLKSSTDYEINKIRLFYKKNGKEITMFEDSSVTDIYVDTTGYDALFPYSDFSTVFDHTFIEISYHENETEIISIRFRRCFINDNVLFFLKGVEKLDSHRQNIVSDKSQKVIDKLKTQGEKNDDSYCYPVEKEDEIFNLCYFLDTGQIYIYDKEDYVLSYVMNSNTFHHNDNYNYLWKNSNYQDFYYNLIDNYFLK